MTQQAIFDWGTDDGWFISSLDEVPERGSGPCLLSPVTATLPPRLADMACTLPIGDANGRLLKALHGGRVTHRVLAAVLASDPFRRADDLLDALWQTGVRGVTNWPSVGLLSGELGTALAHSGFTYTRETTMLQRARHRGMRLAAVVSSEEQLDEALDLRPECLLVVPGLVPGGVDARAARVAEIDRLLRLAASRSPKTHRRLYLHPGFDSTLDRLAKRVHGVIRHAGFVATHASP